MVTKYKKNSMRQSFVRLAYDKTLPAKTLPRAELYQYHYCRFTGPLGGKKKLYHVKFKSKISYLGEKISILPWQMAEQLAVEVVVKNVTQQQQYRAAEQAHLFCLDVIT